MKKKAVHLFLFTSILVIIASLFSASFFPERDKIEADIKPEVQTENELSTEELIQPLEDIKVFTDAFSDPELEPFTGDFDAMKERRLIRALVTPSPTEFFINDGVIRGVQAEYLQQFARAVNKGIRNEAEKIRIKYVPVPFPELIPALLDGRGDIIATFLTITDKRAEQIAFTEPLRRSVNEVIVTHKSIPAPDSIEDLSGKEIYVLANSSYAEHLEHVNKSLTAQELDPILIHEADRRLLSEDILEFINAGVVEYALVDDYIGKLWEKVLKNIVVHDQPVITTNTRVAWAVRKDSRQLLVALNNYIKNIREGALLGNILFQRYYENTEWINNPIEKSERDKLHRYLNMFQHYGNKYGFDPLALAAQAYQESGLNNNKISPAGAIGVMQVLPQTANDPKVNIKNFREPEGNIHAGTKYLAFLRDHYFDDPGLDEWNQHAFSWASYNAGPRKIRHARKVAKKMGLNPNVWFGNVEVAAAKTISREPVRYVANIYRYFVAYRLLSIQEAERMQTTNKL